MIEIAQYYFCEGKIKLLRWTYSINIGVLIEIELIHNNQRTERKRERTDRFMDLRPLFYMSYKLMKVTNEA